MPTQNPFFTPDSAISHLPEPSGGLFLTVMDMARFYQMVLDGGLWRARKVLNRELVAEMLRANAIPKKSFNYGIGLMFHTECQKPIKGLPVGSFGQGGVFFTNGWVVPGQRLVLDMMMQNALVPRSG